MEKEILCPECKADLVKEGFYSDEEVLMRYCWDWNKKEKYFDSDDGKIEEGDNAPEFNCSACDEDITAFVREEGLV